MNYIKDYTRAIGDKLNQALNALNLELSDMQLVPTGNNKFVIRGIVTRPILCLDKVFAVEVEGKLGKMEVKQVDSFIEYLLPKIKDAFYGENATKQLTI